MTGNAEEGRIVPTYQYVCTSCEAPLEVVQTFSDPSLTECPACEGGQLRKVFSAVGVVFKGSGFYRTDSRAGSKTGGSGTGGDAKGAADKGGESGATAAKSDAAPAAKGGSKAAGTSSTSPSTAPSTSSAKPAAKSA